MPILDYVCKCGKRKDDELVKSTDVEMVCECGEKMKRQMGSLSPVGFRPGGKVKIKGLKRGGE